MKSDVIPCWAPDSRRSALCGHPISQCRLLAASDLPAPELTGGMVSKPVPAPAGSRSNGDRALLPLSGAQPTWPDLLPASSRQRMTQHGHNTFFFFPNPVFPTLFSSPPLRLFLLPCASASPLS